MATEALLFKIDLSELILKRWYCLIRFLKLMICKSAVHCSLASSYITLKVSLE